MSNVIIPRKHYQGFTGKALERQPLDMIQFFLFNTLSAANFPVRIDIGTPAGL